jgi:hypothetical protein
VTSDEQISAEMLPARVIRILLFLAAPTETQMSMLTDPMYSDSRSLDDFAEDLDAFVAPIWMSVNAGLLTRETKDELTDLLMELASFSGSENAPLWAFGQLKSPEWESVRNKARAILGNEDIRRYLGDPPLSAKALVGSLQKFV